MRGATLVRGREISSGALVDDADGAAAEEQEELRRKTRTSSSSGEDGDDVGDGGTGAVVARAAVGGGVDKKEEGKRAVAELVNRMPLVRVAGPSSGPAPGVGSFKPNSFFTHGMCTD